MNIGNRLQKLRQELTTRELDAVFISQPENRYYLSNFDGSDGFLLITPQDTALVTDFRYIEQGKRQAPDCEIFQITGSVADWFPKLIANYNIRTLGFEAGNITFSLYQQLTDALAKGQSSVKLIATERLVEPLRAIKEPQEIALISQAVAISDRAFEYVADRIRPGMTEKDVAWEIEKFMRENGSQALPFDIIVAAGPNAALPHARPSERVIAPGEPVVIDIGARVNGYGSDLSRTIYLGSPDEVLHKVYDTVLKAQLAAIAAIQDSFTGDQADKVARNIIEEAGYGPAFGHALGHGIGLVTHESPRLGPHSPDVLLNGMVFSIEPGIYLSGWGGVRIEDTVVMENGKINVLSRSRKNRPR